MAFSYRAMIFIPIPIEQVMMTLNTSMDSIELCVHSMEDYGGD